MLLTAPIPGSVEEAISHIQVGMNIDEAVAQLKCCKVDSVHFSAVTQKGEKFFNFGFADILPPAKIDHGNIYVMDDYGIEAEVYFQRGGIVSRIEWTPLDSAGERLLIKIRHALDHRLIRKAIGRMACEKLGL